jgi:hypothetical protein
MRAEVEAFWNAEKRRKADSEAALWAKVDRYEAALFELAAMAEEVEKLVKHRNETGEAVTDIDQGRWFALLKVRKKAGEALGLGPEELQAELLRRGLA